MMPGRRPSWLRFAALLAFSTARPAVAIAAEPAQDALRAVHRSLAEEDWPAARTRLEEAAAAHPEDCAVRAWLAWFEIESGHGDPGEALLRAAGCPAGPEDRGRWPLLRALGAEHRDDAAATRDALLEVGERQPLWPEDRTLVRTLSGRHLEGYTLPLEVRAADARRVALPYRDLGERSVLWDDSMRRLLRQEEDLAADCGCAVP